MRMGRIQKLAYGASHKMEQKYHKDKKESRYPVASLMERIFRRAVCMRRGVNWQMERAAKRWSIQGFGEAR